MPRIRNIFLAFLTGALAGLAALFLDEFLALFTLGHLLWLSLPVVAGYGICGALVAALAVLWRRARGRASLAGLGALTLALLYMPAIFERFFKVLAPRISIVPAVATAMGVVAAYGVWLVLLRRIAARSAEGPALCAGALTAAAGLAINRNLVSRPFEPLALAVDAAILLAALAVVTATRWMPARLLGGVLAAAGALAAAAILAAGPRLPEPTAPVREPRPHLVLVIIDTLRQDVFQAVVAQTAEGRAFKDAMADAAWFSQAIAAAPWTAPSMGSIMTGLYPSEHGFGVTTEAASVRPLASSEPTLAEDLGRVGYVTAGIGTNVLLRPSTGIARGFGYYEILTGAKDKLPLATALVEAGVLEYEAYQPADSVRRQLERHLGPLAASGRPFFLWLHLMDPHVPLYPHRGLASSPAAAGLAAEERIYRDEVRFALKEIVRILERLRAHGLFDDALVVVASDHGEMFPSDGHDDRVAKPKKEHGIERFRHGHGLYEELMRVPLVIRPPGGLEGHRFFDVMTSHVDLRVTLLDVLGLGEFPRRRDRTSLAPYLAVTLPAAGALPARADTLLSGIMHGPRQRGVRTPDFKLIEHDSATTELYHLTVDPGEHHDLGVGPEAASLRGRLDELWSALATAPEADASDLDAATRRRLEALGYIE